METTDFFKDTFEYNYHFNQELIQLFENNKQNIPEKSIKLLNHLKKQSMVFLEFEALIPLVRLVVQVFRWNLI